MLLQIQNADLSIGGQTLLSQFDFHIKSTEKIALVGRNGCGKTTFLRLLAGERSPDASAKTPPMVASARRLTVGFLRQQAFSDLTTTVEEELLKSCPCPDRWDRERFAWEQEYDRVFTRFGFGKEDKKKRLSCFSGGEQTKIALIRLLLEKPDVLLLDEPTNHLDTATVEWLESYLTSYPHAAVIVSHDRYFLDQTADVVYEFQSRRLVRYSGNYTAYREQKHKNFALQEKAYKHQQDEIRRLEDLIERFKHKPKKAAFARSRKKILERMEKVEQPQRDDAHIFTGSLTPAFLSSKWVLEADHLKIGYDKSLSELTLRVRRGQKIGVIGPNGAGKSAFLKTAAGLLPPVKGKLSLGLNVDIGYFDQQAISLSSEKTVLEHFHDSFPSLSEKEVRDILGAFLFTGKDAMKKVSSLSGGEKSRLVLAELLQKRPNFLLLDEPTNHMDIPARETLESAFRAYTGTLLFVSHDRYFIRQAAEALLVFEDRDVFYYPFGYDHYVERRLKQKDGADGTARIRAEEQALISGLKNVPKAERHMLKEISEEQAYAEWQMRLMLEPLRQCEEELEAFLLSLNPALLWEDPAYEADFRKKEAELYQMYTKRCLNWYEKWSEFTDDNMHK